MEQLADRQSDAVWGLFKAWNEHYVKHGWRDILTGLPLKFDADFFDRRRPSLAAHRRHHTHYVWGTGNERNVRVETWSSNALLKSWRYPTLTAIGASASATAERVLRSLLVTHGHSRDKDLRRALIVALPLAKTDSFELRPENCNEFALNGAEAYEHQLLGLPPQRFRLRTTAFLIGASRAGGVDKRPARRNRRELNRLMEEYVAGEEVDRRTWSGGKALPEKDCVYCRRPVLGADWNTRRSADWKNRAETAPLDRRHQRRPTSSRRRSSTPASALKSAASTTWSARLSVAWSAARSHQGRPQSSGVATRRQLVMARDPRIQGFPKYKDVTPGEGDRDKSVRLCAERFDWGAPGVTMLDFEIFYREDCKQGGCRGWFQNHPNRRLWLASVVPEFRDWAALNRPEWLLSPSPSEPDDTPVFSKPLKRTSQPLGNYKPPGLDRRDREILEAALAYNWVDARDTCGAHRLAPHPVPRLRLLGRKIHRSHGRQGQPPARRTPPPGSRRRHA